MEPNDETLNILLNDQVSDRGFASKKKLESNKFDYYLNTYNEFRNEGQKHNLPASEQEDKISIFDDKSYCVQL